MGAFETSKFVARDIGKLFPELTNNKNALDWCLFNEASGPGFLGRVNGEVVGFGGLRTVGIAEAWLYVAPGIAEKRLSARITILRGLLEHLEYVQQSRCINKIWAEAIKDDGFSHTKQFEREDLLRFMGFKKNEQAYTKTIFEA